jgi:RNase P/RNase MRP subunit POP5
MARAFQPTLKEKKRYVVYEPAGDSQVLEAFQELFGTHGKAQAGIVAVQQNDGRSVLRVAHTSTDRLKAAIAWSGKRSLATSGTLRKARETL